MKIPAIKKPVESLKYMAQATIPCIVLAYVQKQYRKTPDERLLAANSYLCDRLRNIVQEHYTKIEPERIPKLMKEIDNIESRLKETKKINEENRKKATELYYWNRMLEDYWW
ncbi:hypothetical protein FJZ53_00895 [Candidatus Woesearchaeota archaeon]|nr:hypothetical protein [Candidatus Woesearchaeota archaeon]